MWASMRLRTHKSNLELQLDTRHAVQWSACVIAHHVMLESILAVYCYMVAQPWLLLLA